MKKFIKVLMIMLILPVAFMFVGCSSNDVVSIKSITKTNSTGLVDTYTITYTDGSTSQFVITNGEDGENIYSNITINDLFQQVKNSGTKPSEYTIVDFVNEYLDIKVDNPAIISSKALRSSVAIYVEHQITIPDYNSQTGYNPLMGYTYGVTNSISLGAGSGIIYDLNKQTGDAYILTNYHVCFSNNVNAEDGIATRFTLYIYGGETLSTSLNDLAKYNENNSDPQYYSKFNFDENGLPIVDYGWGAISAEYVGGSEQYDIAVLKVSNSEILKNSDCLQADVYDSDFVSAGSTAIAVGNPGAGGIAVTKGIVSIESTYTEIQINDLNPPVSLREFRIDTPVNGGNSGGGLYDAYGRLIGVVNAKLISDSYDDINYAIPTNVAVRVAQSIIDMCDGVNRTPQRILMGMSIQTIDCYGYYDEEDAVMRIKETIRVALVNENSLASSMGLDEDYIITSVDIIKENETISVEVERRHQILDILLYARVGDQVRINYTNNGVAGSATSVALTNENFIDIK